MNGILPLNVGKGKYFAVIGGPYREVPKGTIGVKMAKELNLPCAIDIPTHDFNVPHLKDLDAGLTRAVAAIVAGDPVYVGCMAGRGRTGLFLAVLAKAFGVPDPVEYVRREYYAHAVENKKQYDFVAAYKIPLKVVVLVKFAKAVALFRRKGALTNLDGVLD